MDWYENFNLDSGYLVDNFSYVVKLRSQYDTNTQRGGRDSHNNYYASSSNKYSNSTVTSPVYETVDENVKQNRKSGGRFNKSNKKQTQERIYEAIDDIRNDKRKSVLEPNSVEYCDFHKRLNHETEYGLNEFVRSDGIEYVNERLSQDYVTYHVDSDPLSQKTNAKDATTRRLRKKYKIFAKPSATLPFKRNGKVNGPLWIETDVDHKNVGSFDCIWIVCCVD